MNSVIVRHQAGEISEESAGNLFGDFISASLRECVNFNIRSDGGLERRKGTRFISRSWAYENGGSYTRLFPARYAGAGYLLEFGCKAGELTRVRVYDENGNPVSFTGTYPDTYTFLMPSAGAGYKNKDFDPVSMAQAGIVQAGNLIEVFHPDYPPVTINVETWTASYKTLYGNPFLADDLDAELENSLAPGSLAVFALIGGELTSTSCTAREAKNINDVATVEISQEKAKPSWIGSHVRVYGSGRVGLIEITGIISASAIIGVVKQTDITDSPFTNVGHGAKCDFWPPVEGTSVDITFTHGILNANNRGLTVMIDDGAFRLDSVTSATSGRFYCVSRCLSINAGAAVSGVARNAANIIIPRFVRKWARPAWGYDPIGGEKGWPSIAAYWQGRLFCARSHVEPRTIWGSATNEPNRFAPGPDDNDPVQWEILTGSRDGISAIGVGDIMFIGTESSIHRVLSSNEVTGSNFKTVASIGYGVERVAPVLVSGWLYFVRKGGHLITVRYNDSTGAVEDHTATRFAGHIAEMVPVELAVETLEDTRIIARLNNGGIAVGNIVESLVLPSWSRHTYNGIVNSVAVVKGKSEKTFIAVSRPNGEMIEMSDDSVYLDSSITVGATPVPGGLEINGLDHLNGETVAVLAGGHYYKDLTVSSGSVFIETPDTSGTAIVGIPFTSRIITGRPIITRDASDTMRLKRVVSVGVRVINTVALSARGFVDYAPGPKVDFPLLRTNSNMDNPPPPFSGDTMQHIVSTYDTNGSVIIETDSPWNAIIALIRIELDTRGGYAPNISN